jgi:tRNA A-37 threonylcarbamoyl transferase component Bud32
VTERAEAPAPVSGARRGQVVAGKYRVERLLGRGGMGEVYEARHVVVGRRFAIKFLHPGIASGNDANARFLREAQAAGALDNEHIAAVVDFDRADDGAPFLVMEYLHGETLATTLRREGVLPVPRALGILLQACDGLAAAHEAGIVHRDLKPDNLFLVARPDASELLKIVDFGVAKLVSGEPNAGDTQSGAVLGTPLYMAPEQARGEKTVDFRVDIHALGVIAYELLSGERPHPGDGYNAILAHILTRPARPLRELCPDVPDGLRRVIERAMAFEPSARHESAADLSRALAPFAGREVTSRAAQFDLRRANDVKVGAVTLDTPADTQAPVEGTLQSAVGEARVSSMNGNAGRRLWPWGVLAVGAALLWLLARDRQAPPSAANGHAETLPVAAPTPPVSVADRLGPEATARSLSPTPVAAVSAGVAAAEAKAKPSAGNAKRLPGPVVSGRSKVVEGQGEVTFDEKNPY